MIKPIPQKLFYCFILALLYNYNGYTQNIDFGKSYVNITKGLNGGTVEPGDTLEIRAVFVVRSGAYDSCAFFDIIPTGTAYIPGTIRVLTNEGKIYKQFTDVPNDDEGWISGSNIRINMGYNQTDAPARSFRRGRLRNTHKPNFGNAVIQIASFRVRVTAALGSIINTGSVAGLRTGFGPYVYSAAKAAVIHLSRCAAMELGEWGVRVNCICPGGIVTPIFGKAFGLSTDQADETLGKVSELFNGFQPIPRPGHPKDIAAAAVFLASDESSFVNGHALVVDGGLIGGRRFSEVQETFNMMREQMGVPRKDFPTPA